MTWPVSYLADVAGWDPPAPPLFAIFSKRKVHPGHTSSHPKGGGQEGKEGKEVYAHVASLATTCQLHVSTLCMYIIIPVLETPAPLWVCISNCRYYKLYNRDEKPHHIMEGNMRIVPRSYTHVSAHSHLSGKKWQPKGLWRLLLI